jgi:hypothetical protein
VGSGANVGYLTVVSRWKEVISNGDAFVKSGGQHYCLRSLTIGVGCETC